MAQVLGLGLVTEVLGLGLDSGPPRPLSVGRLCARWKTADG